MATNPSGLTFPINKVDEVLDTNDTAETTAALNVRGGALGLMVLAASGTHATHHIRIQVSDDGTNWHTHYSSTLGGITGTGAVPHIPCAFPLARAKVTTAEGAASTCTVILMTTTI